MKKYVLVCLTVLLLAISNLNAKTIWVLDLTNNHNSMVTFYNALIEDLMLTQYKQNIKTVSDKTQIKELKGDIILELNGNGLSTDNGNVTYFYWVGCSVDNCDNWAYRSGGGCVFSDNNIYKYSREIRMDIVDFLDTWF